MDDGVLAIILIISVLIASYVVFTMVFEGLFIVFLIIVIVLIPMLVYTSILALSTTWDKHKATKEWRQVEEIKKIQPSPVDTIKQEQKNKDS